MIDLSKHGVIIDDKRKDRLGFPEIVYGESKTAEQIQAITDHFIQEQQNLLITRLNPRNAPTHQLGEGICNHNTISQTLRIQFPDTTATTSEHHIGLVTAGSSDMSVALEAQETLHFLGHPSILLQDVGVAGIHRLLDRLHLLEKCKVIIVFAGFEGALAPVIAGLLPQPIIGVPTSVGYGVAKNGHAALSTMLGSCANGITVMNIDNGCGAATAAVRILNMLK